MLHHIYGKTRKGHDEIVRPTFGLNTRQRRILAFVDGARTLSGLIGQFPVKEMEDIVLMLSSLEFIFLVSAGPAEHASQPAPENAARRSRSTNTSALTSAPEKISKAREFMLETATIHLGILGRDIIQKIEFADSAHSLACLAGQWAMALCASKSAARYAQLYLEQLKLILFEEQSQLSGSPDPDMSSWRHMRAL
jgi:hypothetical protein